MYIYFDSPAMICMCDNEGILVQVQRFQLIKNPPDAEICLAYCSVVSFACNLLHLNRPGQVCISWIVGAIGHCEINQTNA